MVSIKVFYIKRLGLLFSLISLCHSMDLYSESYKIESCGSDNGTIIRIKDVVIMPDPVVVPGIVILGFTMEISKTIYEPIGLDYAIQRQVGKKWITVSCSNDDHGTCNVKDVCKAFHLIPFCPKAVADELPCKCPLLKKSYTVDAFPIPLLLDGPVVVGQYKAQVKASNWMYGELMCYNLQLEIISSRHH